MRVIQNRNSLLAHWIYTREEWSFFERWRWKRKSLLLYWWKRLAREPQQELKEVTLTGQRVWVNDRVEVFTDDLRRLRRVHLREAGSLHVLEIIYQVVGQPSGRIHIIQIPVPRGKLREAMIVQECLSGNAF